MNRVEARQPTAKSILSRRKRILFWLLTAALLAVFAELSLQLFYRLSVGQWLWQWWTAPIFEKDPIRVYRLKPNLDYLHKTSEYTARYCTDDAGMRSDGHHASARVPKPPNTVRILSLGPSFAFGWAANYEDAYINRIVSGLRVPGKRIELVNLGTPAQPVCYQLKWLRETGYVYQPDIIVQTIYGYIDSVDPDDTLPEDRPSVRDGYLYPTEHMTFSMRIRWLRRYSALLFYGWHLYQAVSGLQTPAVAGTEFYKKAALSETNAPAECLKRYRGYIQFVHSVLTNEPPIVFIYVPPAWAVRPADFSRVAHHGNLPLPWALRERNALLVGVLRSNQVNVIDTLPALVQHDAQGRTYHLFDTHFTVLGNKVVADLATPIIQQILDSDARWKN
jgi:hypothetical protein